MPRPNDEIVKRYYTISEIAKMFDVSKSLIRFWESEFDILRPHKNSKGDRRFTQENITQIRIIYNLVKEKGFTLKGAKKEIKLYKERLKAQEKTIKSLKKIRAMLVQLKAQI